MICLSKKLLLLTIALLLTACNQDQSERLVEPAPVKMANPAAVFCIDQGGEYDLTDSSCKLEDGRVVDAWDYYHQKKATSSDQNNVTLANPAAVYCEEHGHYDLATDKCHLSSGEVVDAWDYYRSHHKP